jgi:hypothetical protein
MKLLFWNSYHAFTRSKPPMLPPLERAEAAIKLISELDVDCLILLEMTEDNEEKCSPSMWNHQHFLRTQEGLLVSTKRELRNPRLWKENMLRGLLQIPLSFGSLLVAHIPPEQYAQEALELRGFLSPLLALLRQEEPFLLLSDLNRSANSHWVETIQGLGIKQLQPQQGTDHVFLSPYLAHNVEVEILTGYEQLSDHAPILITLSESAETHLETKE